MPEIKKILSTKHFLNIENVEIEKGKVLYEGTITLLINYLSRAEGTNHQFYGSVFFQDFIDVPGAEKGMTAVVQPEVKNLKLMEHDKEKRIITVDVMLNTLARVNKAEEVSFVIDAPVQCKVKKEEITLNQVLSSAKGKLVKSEEVTIPALKSPVKELLGYRCVPLVQNYKLALGSITINGWLQLEITYLDSLHNRQHLQRLINFSKLLPVPEAREEYLAEVHVAAHDTEVNLLPGQSCLSVQARVDFLVHVLCPRQIKVVTAVDCCTAEVTAGELVVENLTSVKSSEAIIRDISTPAEEYTGYDVHDIRVGPVTILSADMVKDKVLMRGCADFIVEFIDTKSAGKKYIYRKVFFKSMAVVNKDNGSARVETFPVVEFAGAELKDNQLIINAVLHVIVRTLVLNRYKVVFGVDFLNRFPNVQRETISFTYVFKKGDTLDALAERFGTTVEALVKINPGIDAQKPLWGQKIRIPCQVKK
nr:SPOCS domain-containing protein [Desulforadius tongensis]